ncbi:MAG: NADH-quinone oxidoreductase subunit J [Chlamydiota bacterium]|nr:NADH-quinone oxidoreductase subunit J [Chlamydiota bacterium]
MQQIELILFYVFSAVTLTGALGVVVLRNTMRAAISLLFSLLGVAALFFLRHAEFLGAVQLLVYAGGIVVLFLFAIMFVPANDRTHRKWHLQWPVALLIALLFGISILYFVGYHQWVSGKALDAFTEGGGNTEAIGVFLYRNYLVPFEAASLFLLVAMIGAILLGRWRDKL